MVQITWSSPMTAVAGSVFTAAQFNQSVRDNLNETAPAKATAAGQIFVSTATNAIAARTPNSASVSNSDTTTSTSFVDLAHVGPSVTATTGATAILFIAASLQNSGAGNSLVGVNVSGASSISATGLFGGAYGTGGASVGLAWLQGGLTPGSNIFKLQYAVSTGTGTFSARALAVIPL